MARIRNVRWWQRWLDPDVRRAHKRLAEATNYVTVDYTDGGIAITMPVEIAAEWEAMPYDARQDFMQEIDAQVKG
jgi:hypothetical protein